MTILLLQGGTVIILFMYSISVLLLIWRFLMERLIVLRGLKEKRILRWPV